MKNVHQERLRTRARLAHRNNDGDGGRGSVFTMHEFEPGRAQTWWDDISFVLNSRRVMVWWVHPRMKYRDAIDDAAWKQMGESPMQDDHSFNGKTIYKPAGRSRKRIVAYRSSPTPDALAAHYEKRREIKRQLERDGMNHIVTPSMSITNLNWCTGVDLCVPLEIRCQADAVALAALARKLLTREATLATEFPSYTYGQVEWLAEAKAREDDAARKRGADD